MGKETIVYDNSDGSKTSHVFENDVLVEVNDHWQDGTIDSYEADNGFFGLINGSRGSKKN